jgi:hypothetical protein
VKAVREVIEIHVDELIQLFHSIDPSPFPERDLDPRAEEFIVAWARESRRDARLALVVHMNRPGGKPDEAAGLERAIQGFFARRALTSRRSLRQLFRRGRVSLLIGIIFLALSIGAGEVLVGMLAERRLGPILRESVLIGGWVAMWRPLEIFLYDWWPILAEARLFDRLAVMPVRIEAEAPAGRLP